ncbi:MAG: hypothetical protein QM778_08620 [Myxococcales bacterium]
MKASLLAVCVLGLGCGGASANPVLSTTPPPVTALEGTEDALELRVEAAARALRDQGFTRAPFQDRGFLPTNGRATRAVTIDPHTCARFVAVATPSVIDLDASLYRSDGTALLEDDGSDARPSLMLCAGDTRVDGYYSLHAYQGVGAYATAQFVRPAIQTDDLLTISEPARESALNELAKTLHKRGFEDAGPRVEAQLNAGQPLRVAISARAGDCYTVATESAAGLGGVSLRLLDGDNELGHGVAAERLASLQYCADQARELALEVSASTGEGMVRIARFRAAQAAVGGPHAMWLGEPSPSREAWRAAKQTSSAQQTTQGADKSTFAQEFPLSQGAVVELEHKVPLGACERWRALLEPGLSRATLRIEGLDGSLYGQAESSAMVAEVAFCGRHGALRVSVTGRAGFGRVSLLGQAEDPKAVEPDSAHH